MLFRSEDLVRHFEDRVAALDGKAMIVCMSRRICVALYEALVKVRPEWHSDDDEKGKLKVSRRANRRSKAKPLLLGKAARPLRARLSRTKARKRALCKWVKSRTRRTTAVPGTRPKNAIPMRRSGRPNARLCNPGTGSSLVLSA